MPWEKIELNIEANSFLEATAKMYKAIQKKVGLAFVVRQSSPPFPLQRGNRDDLWIGALEVKRLAGYQEHMILKTWGKADLITHMLECAKIANRELLEHALEKEI